MLWAFDLMHHNGHDLRAIHLEDRQRRLAYLVGRAAIGRLLHSVTFEEGDNCSRNAARGGWRAW